MALRTDGATLWLRVEPRAGTPPPVPLIVTLAGEQDRRAWTLPEDQADRCGVGAALEAALHLPAGPALLAIELEHERLPLEGFLRLELVEVDEP